jgi:tRNA C32,U32 (ribose-2'-O)-methylase TrmJ
LYELATRTGSSIAESKLAEGRITPDSKTQPSRKLSEAAPTSGNLDILAGLIEEVMEAANYSPKLMQEANRHDLRLMLRRLNLSAADSRRALGLFRRVLRRLRIPQS